MLLRNGLLWMAGNTTLRNQITGSPLVRPVARRFVAGETPQEALDVTERLNAQGAAVALDHLGENVTSEEEAEHVRRTYVELVDEVIRRELRCYVSVKLTALGLDISRELCETNLRAILDAGREQNILVRLDMEGSDYTQVTLDIFEQMWAAGFRNIGIVLQSYLYRTMADVERAVELGAGVRLCKGAYKEPPAIAYPEKADVDRNYIECARRLLSDGSYPGLATHDSAIIDWTRRFVAENNIDNQRWEFQMLYGVRRDLQRRLIEQGYNLRVYVPFGDAWYPYLMRRMAERPANLLFILRSLRYS
jgi:proline dehydrogenase